MTKEGELKKRIERAHQEYAFFSQDRDYFQEIVDEAKKDFPRDSHSTHNWIAEVKKWKAKWFGDSS